MHADAAGPSTPADAAMSNRELNKFRYQYTPRFNQYRLFSRIRSQLKCHTCVDNVVDAQCCANAYGVREYVVAAFCMTQGAQAHSMQNVAGESEMTRVQTSMGNCGSLPENEASTDARGQGAQSHWQT